MLYVATYSISLQVIFYSFTKEDGMVFVLAQNRKDQCYKADLFRKKTLSKIASWLVKKCEFSKQEN